ncbi:hypothetical protein EJV47_26010 [Hymenobacter gummosus]|uniref:DUF7674 domain-containing protein n=1 Tax=Hymenobacter gummosus TaxID=1776032 RepID=A0A431TVD9_9BACT|nr:hypothetical protein [Hymenobacter gummosus]RTQ45328.1 hypothetical protein EJV47_26010 [Hymenobacter gummosus]
MDQRIDELFDGFIQGRLSRSELEKELQQLTGKPDPRNAFAASVEASNEELLRMVAERSKGLPELPAQPSTVHAHFTALAATIPGLSARWEAHLQAHFPGLSVEQLSDAVGGFSYRDMAVFGNQVLELLTTGETTALGAFFRQVDAMLDSDDHRTNELTAMGLLEGLQNQLIESSFDHHTALDAWLPPATKHYWDKLNDFWEGK